MRSPSPPCHASALLFPLPTSPFLLPSPILLCPSHFSRPLPSPQGSGRYPSELSSRRASAAVCPALVSFCGAEKRAAAACAAPWRTSAQVAAPWTAPARAGRRPSRSAPAPPPFGPLLRPPAARGPRHPGSSSLEVFPARPPASRGRSRHLAAAPRARGRVWAFGGLGESQRRLGLKRAPVRPGDAETVQSAPAVLAGTPSHPCRSRGRGDWEAAARLAAAETEIQPPQPHLLKPDPLPLPTFSWGWEGMSEAAPLSQGPRRAARPRPRPAATPRWEGRRPQRRRADPSQRGESLPRPGPFSRRRTPGSHRHKARRVPPRRRGAPSPPPPWTLSASTDPHPLGSRRSPPGRRALRGPPRSEAQPGAVLARQPAPKMLCPPLGAPHGQPRADPQGPGLPTSGAAAEPATLDHRGALGARLFVRKRGRCCARTLPRGPGSPAAPGIGDGKPRGAREELLARPARDSEYRQGRPVQWV